MKRRVLFLGTVLLIGNLAFALPSNQNMRVRADISKYDNAFVRNVVDQLVARGLDYDVAEARVATLFGDDHAIAAISLHNFKLAFPEISHEHLIAYLSDRALFEKQMNMASYDTLVHMLQKTGKKLALSNESYQKLEQVARLNSSIELS